MSREFVRRLVNHYPRLKAVLLRMLRLVMPSQFVSTHYVESADAQADSQRLRSAWQNEELPQRQRRLVEKELGAFRQGNPVVAFDVFVRSLRTISGTTNSTTLLEIGCSSGYYNEVMRHAGLEIQYSGCDYSKPFIDLARDLYPELRFDVEDATALTYADNAFDIVVSGCCLLHIPEYGTAISETARVARSHAVFHRTPVLIGSPTKCYVKRAYGIDTVEFHFNEAELLDLFDRVGLELLETHSWGEEIAGGKGKATRTYVCRKRAES
jgi:2-polyprenyl-3-methyl-5-hydroxy-6-metoxy-1,4-benzoquinol methylase